MEGRRMKKVLLIAQAEYSDCADGVQKKVRAQADAFERLGNEVHCVFYFHNKVTLSKTNCTDYITLDEHNGCSKRMYFWKKVKELVSYDYDLVFIRYSFIDIQVLGVLKKIHGCGVPAVIEIPSIETPLYMYKGFARIQYRIDQVLGKKCKKYVNKVLYIGEGKRKALGCTAYPIPNGIPYGFDHIERTGYVCEKKVIRLLAVSMMGKSRGFDRVIRGCINYYKNKNRTIRIEVSFVGEGECLEELRKMTAANGLEDCIFFRGKLSGEALEKEFKEASLGIGGLGLFHLGACVCSTLKIKEYLLRGLPFIYAGREAGIPPDFKYALNIENCDVPVDMDQVVRFAGRLSALNRDTVIREMSDFALKNFDWKNILNAECGEFLC